MLIFLDENTTKFRRIVGVELLSTITRLQIGHVRPPWTVRPLLPGVIGLDKSGESGLDILGSTTVGIIYQITLLNEAAWRLLRYIQNLVQTYHYEQDAFTTQTRVTDMIEPVPGMEANVYHISSEFLDDALKAGSQGLVKMMGYEGPPWNRDEPPIVNLADLNARKARVGQLVAELLGKEVDDPIEFTVDYIRQLLGSIW
jgi:hypothetical protein